MRLLQLLFFLCSTSSQGTLAYNLCCPPGQHFHETNHLCVDGPPKQPKQPPFNVEADEFNQELKCEAYEVYPFDDVELLEQNEEIRVRRYKDPIPPGDYCIDGDNFVLCDKCKQSGIECISLCCPFNYRSKRLKFPPLDSFDPLNSTEIPIFDFGPPEKCVQSASPMPPLEFHQYNNDKLVKLDLKEKHDFIYIGPTKIDKDFNEHLHQCPIPGTYTIDVDNKDGDIFLDGKGRLHNVKRNSDEKETLERGDFCVSYDEDQELIYMYCSVPNLSDVPNECENIRKKFFDAGFVLSILGILLSLILLFLPKVAFRRTPSGKISIIYLINMLGQFTVITVERFSNFEPQTTSCEAVGYLQQYFNLSFFFSMSALGITSYRLVTTLDFSGPCFNFFDPEKKRYMAFCIGYIQGIPLLITMITLGIDNIRKQAQQNGLLKTHESVSYPEMAVYEGACFLGYQNPDKSNRPSYFVTPEFIYVQSFQLLIIIMNTILFTLTAIAYNNANIRPTDKDKWEHRKESFVAMAKIFVFMIFLWIFEIVTSSIAADYGINETCEVRFVLDTPNLLFGLFVFYVMIISRPTVKKQVRESLEFITLTTNSNSK